MTRPESRLAAQAPVGAIAVVSLSLATIPYGAPMPGWYLWLTGTVALMTAVMVLADGTGRWRTIVWWPAAAILGAWTLSIVSCRFPTVVAERSWGMAFYGTMFFAAQVACWSERGRRRIMITVLSVVAVIAIDMGWQRYTGRSLIRDVRASVVQWNGDAWVERTASGSLGNRNDQAVVGVLAPLMVGVVPSIWALGLVGLAAAFSGYVALIGASRQLLLGLASGAGVASLLRLPRGARWWVAGAVVTALLATALAHAGTRARILELADKPLGDRGLPMVYGLELAVTHPLFGVGPSLYGHYYVQGVREGWSFRGEQLSPSGMPWVHSLPIEIACEFGAVGIAAYAAVLCVFVRRLRQAVHAGGPARDLAIAVTGSAVAFAVMGLIDLTFIKDWVRICWWLVLGLGFAAARLPGAPGGLQRPSETP